MIDPDRQWDWLAGFAATPNWHTAAARAVVRTRHDIQANESELKEFILKQAGKRRKRALSFANPVLTKIRPLALTFDLLALGTADPADGIRHTVSRAVDPVGASKTRSPMRRPAGYECGSTWPMVSTRSPGRIFSMRQKYIGKMGRS
ncbi:hypothetical protein V1291_003586 [Nitrobacteraceae bacterium AZCC 1564]